MKSAQLSSIDVCGRTIQYRIVRSKTARHLRLRVGLNGVEVVQPASRSTNDIVDFLQANGNWIIKQLDRTGRLRGVRRNSGRTTTSEIMFRGQSTPVVIKTAENRRMNKIVFDQAQIVIYGGAKASTPVARSLENWLRKLARNEIERLLISVTARLKRPVRNLYVMGQRTKWGNCSAKQNLSFNWRLVLAPEFVLRYLVTHEVVHLVVPDHSSRFWLTVQSICPEAQRARHWLRANGHLLLDDLKEICERQ